MTKIILDFCNFVKSPKNSGADVGERITCRCVSAFRMRTYIHIYIYIYITKMSASFSVFLFLCFIPDFFHYFRFVSVSLCSSKWPPVYFSLYFIVISMFLTLVYYRFVYSPCLFFFPLFFFLFLLRFIAHYVPVFIVYPVLPSY